MVWHNRAAGSLSRAWRMRCRSAATVRVPRARSRATAAGGPMAAGTVGHDPVSPLVGPPAGAGPGPSSAAVALGLSGLLRAAEWHAEQMLHVGRGLLALALAVIVLGIWRGGEDWSLPVVVGALVAIALAWAAIAWLLFRGPYVGWLAYVLIALDGLLLV